MPAPLRRAAVRRPGKGLCAAAVAAVTITAILVASVQTPSAAEAASTFPHASEDTRLERLAAGLHWLSSPPKRTMPTFPPHTVPRGATTSHDPKAVVLPAGARAARPLPPGAVLGKAARPGSPLPRLLPASAPTVARATSPVLGRPVPARSLPRLSPSASTSKGSAAFPLHAAVAGPQDGHYEATRSQALAPADAHTLVYANPDGTRSARISASPVAVGDGRGGWTPLDLTLVPSGESGSLEGESEYPVKDSDGQDITDIGRVEDGVLWEGKSSSVVPDAEVWVERQVVKKLNKYVRARSHLPGYEDAPIGLHMTSRFVHPELRGAVESAVEAFREANPGLTVHLRWEDEHDG